MAIFKWEGKNSEGKIMRGEIEAANSGVAVVQLRKQKIIPLNIKQQNKKTGAFPLDLSSLGTVSEKEVAVFTRQLATMIDAGLPLVQSLEIQASQQDNPLFKKHLEGVKNDVEGGSTFSDALRKQPKTFDNLYTNLVTAGEIGGTLDVILNRLSQYMEKSIALKKRVKGAMYYPASIVAISILVISILLIKVIPVFEKMFKGFGEALPMPTQIIINMSHFLKDNLGMVIVGVIAFIIIMRQYYKTGQGRLLIDRFALKLPVFGPLILKIATARFSRTLGTLVSSGVPILDGLQITAKTSGNQVVENAIMETRESISEGKTIAEPLQNSKVFPGMVVQMISVGESTGALDSMLNKIADFYDEEVDATVDALTSLLEPLMMVFLGTSIGGMMIAMYMPIFKMASVVS